MKEQNPLSISITVLGISSIITQILVMREFLSVFYGNELVFGIILANWLILTGTGSYLGKYAESIKDKISFFASFQVVIAILPFFSILLIRALRDMLFAPGILIDIVQIFTFSFFLLLPYCLISGFLLPLACVAYAPQKDAAQIGRVYFMDSIGGTVGGAIFSFVLVYFLNPFQTAFFVMAINLSAAAMLFSFSGKNMLKYSAVLLLVTFSIFLTLVDADNKSAQWLFKGQELVYQKSSQYGSLAITKNLDQLNFYENGMPLFTTTNTIANEETIHYAMVQHSDPKKVLLISGGIAGTIDEILKYDVESIDYVELDPQIIDAGKRFTNVLENTKVNVINSDGRLYVKQTDKRYDIVIIDLPDPNTAQINRFYTAEFYQELKRILNEGGVVSISLSAPANYLSQEVRNLNSALYKSLKSSFSNIVVIPGERNYFIASDGMLSYDIAVLIQDRGVDTKYVNAFYLSGKLTQERISYVLESTREEVNLNEDFHPVSYYYHLLYWLSRFSLNLIAVAVALLVVVALFAVRLRPASFSIFTTGFAGAGLEVTLLVLFQILYGYVYYMVGVIITAFMLGLAVGAYCINKNKNMGKGAFVALEFSIAVFSIALPFFVLLSSGFGSAIFNAFLIPLLTVILAIFVGIEFPLAARLSFKDVADTSAVLYNADFVGACVGALFVSSLLIPLLGITKVCLFIGVLKILSGANFLIKKS